MKHEDLLLWKLLAVLFAGYIGKELGAALAVYAVIFTVSMLSAGYVISRTEQLPRAQNVLMFLAWTMAGVLGTVPVAIVMSRYLGGSDLFDLALPFVPAIIILPGNRWLALINTAPGLAMAALKRTFQWGGNKP